METLGAINYLHFRLSGPLPDSLLTENGKLKTENVFITAALPPHIPARAGEELMLTVAPSHLHFFDPATGQTINVS